MNTNVILPSASASALPAEGYEFSADLVTLFQGRPREAEAIRTIRTHVLARHLEGGRRGLSLCEPNGHCGCTYIAANLAVSLAQIGVNTLLIDADMRTPGVQHFVRPLNDRGGLRQVLSGELRIGEAVHENVLPNLSILYAGAPTDEAQELLGGEEFKATIQRCLRDYDCTIVDTPPANQCADARRISSVVGYSVVVARRDLSFIGEVAALAKQIGEDGGCVVGTVLNED